MANGSKVPWGVIVVVGALALAPSLFRNLFSWVPGFSSADQELQNKKQEESFELKQEFDNAATSSAWSWNWLTTAGPHHAYTVQGMADIIKFLLAYIPKLTSWNAVEQKAAFSTILAFYKNTVKYKSQSAVIAREYAAATGKDLFSSFRQSLYDFELEQINDYVKSLPTGT